MASNLNEETEQSDRSSGLGGIVGVLVVFALFEVYTIVINMDLPSRTIQANGGDILSVLGARVWPGDGGKLLILAVMLSTIATLETTLIQVTRTLYAMSRERTLPSMFGAVHRSWQTPWVATVAVATVSLVLFVVSNLVGSVSTVLSDAISAIGLQIALYYALAALAAVVAFRRQVFRSVSNFVLMGLLPSLGAAFMTWVFIESIPSLGALVDVIGLGAMALGLIPILFYAARRSPYFQQRPTLGREPVEELAAPVPVLPRLPPAGGRT